MLHRLKRHPIPVKAFFRHSLVLTYAFPEQVLLPLLPPGLILDTHEGSGFLAIALVQTESLRPAFLPSFLGRDFFLSGYRIFSRYRSLDGRLLRGLRILRSDTDRRLMAVFGNLLTHYNYRTARVRAEEQGTNWEVEIRTPDAEADLHVVADLASEPEAPPSGSPFADLREARRFAGPLPFTFDYEPESHSIVRIEGIRKHWDPRPVNVRILENTFLTRTPFKEAGPVLANAFHVGAVPYRWERGIRELLPPEPATS